MSGEKRTPIQILQDTLHHNSQQLYDAKQQTQRLQEEIKNIRRENVSQLQQLSTQLEQRHKRQAKAILSLKSDMKEIAEEHSRQLGEQQRRVMEEMQALESRTDEKVENLRSWTQHRLEEQRRDHRRVAQQQQQDINRLKSDIEKINLREDYREQRARDYISDLDTLICAADVNLPYERYAPGRLDKIRRQLETARKQLADDFPAAVISTVQKAHFDLMDLEEEVLRKDMEFEVTYRTVADAIGGLLAAVRKNRQIRLEDDAIHQEADYWTQGRYQVLENRIEDKKNYIQENKSSLTTEALTEYLDDLEELTGQQEKLISEAVERIISSQLRAEMGDIIAEKLCQQGFDVKPGERGYADSDQRNAYMIKLQNVAGTEIVTVISPDEKTYQNMLSINTYGEDTQDDKARQQRNKDILSSLRQEGLQMGDTISGEQGVEEFYDVKNLIRQGAKKLPSQVLQKAEGLSSPPADQIRTS